MSYKYIIFFIFLVIIVCTIIYLYTDKNNISTPVSKIILTPTTPSLTPAPASAPVLLTSSSTPAPIELTSLTPASTLLTPASIASTLLTPTLLTPASIAPTLLTPAPTLLTPAPTLLTPAPTLLTPAPTLLTPASTLLTTPATATAKPTKPTSIIDKTVFNNHNKYMRLKLNISDIYNNNYCYSNNDKIKCGVSLNCINSNGNLECNDNADISIEQDNTDSKLFKLKTKDKYCSVDLINNIIKCDNNIGSKFKINSVDGSGFILSNNNNYCRSIDNNIYCDTNINNANLFYYQDINNNKLKLNNNSSVDLDKYEMPKSDYKLLGCYNDLPDNKEFPKLALRGTKEECEKYAKDNNYKMYALKNLNINDNKVDCMVHNDKNNTSYNKYGISFEYYMLNYDNRKGLKNTNCVYSSSNTNNDNLKYNINCYDKDNKIINVSSAEAKDKCIINCETTDGIYKKGLYKDIKDQCSRYMSDNYEFRNQNVKAEKCYFGNDTINKQGVRIGPLCSPFEIKCKNDKNEEIIVDSNNKDFEEDLTNNCKKCLNVKTNEYTNTDSDNALLNCINAKDSNITFINKDNTTTQINLNDPNMNSKLTDYGFNTIKCKNPLKENNISVYDNYGFIKDDGSLFGCGIY